MERERESNVGSNAISELTQDWFVFIISNYGSRWQNEEQYMAHV